MEFIRFRTNHLELNNYRTIEHNFFFEKNVSEMYFDNKKFNVQVINKIF